jgi:hypothetical protein
MSYQVSTWIRSAYLSVLFLFPSALLVGQSPQIAIVHVTVINPDRDEVQSDMTVMVESQRITKVAKTRSSRVSKRSVVIDGRGKFLILGLWDMHVHASNSTFARSIFLPLLVANGITGVRSMFDDLQTVRQLRNEIGVGNLIGPRIYSPGPIVDGPKPEWRGSMAVHDAERGRSAVRKLKAEGADFIKSTLH